MPGKFSRNGGVVGLSTVPLDCFLALCVTPPAVSALGAEYGAEGYARRPVRRTPPAPTDPPTIKNDHGLTFGPFGADTGDTVGWVMLMTVANGGGPFQMVAFWELDEHRTPEEGDALVLDPGALELTL